MRTKNDWITILENCNKVVQKKIPPLLQKVAEPPVDYGIGAGGDLIKKVDLEAETAIVNTLKKAKVSCTIISEETGTIKIGKTPEENYVILDPIDGSTNFTRGIPFYATSIAVSKNQTLDGVHTALVSDLIHNITYTAIKKQGAYKNNEKITPSKIKSFEKATIGVDLNTDQPKTLKSLAKLLIKIPHLRHFGANALELCYVADGTIDAFIDIRGKLRTTDLAAAFLILKESNATIMTLKGDPLTEKMAPTEKIAFVAAGNSQIFSQIVKELSN